MLRMIRLGFALIAATLALACPAVKGSAWATWALAAMVPPVALWGFRAACEIALSRGR